MIRALHELGFDGRLYPVNPRHEEVLGHRCYRSLAELPEVPDAAFIGLPAGPSVEALQQAGAQGIGAAVIHAAGFADAGAAGRSLQEELVRIARRHQIVVSGPNNMGVLDVLDRSGMWTLPFDPLPGPVAIISQSGSAAIALTEDPKRLGLAYVITAGNEAVVEVSDYLDYAVSDERVKVILMFLESIRSPAKFAGAAHRAAERGQRIIAIKVGRSQAAQAVVRDHTSAIAGSDETYDAFLRQCGVIRATDFDEMLELATLFAASPDPPASRCVVALTMSGGEAALTADLAADAAQPLLTLPRATRRALRQVLGTLSLPSNPIDAWGLGWDEARFRAAVTQLASDRQPSTIIAVLDAPSSGGGDAQIARAVVRTFAELRAATGKHFIILTTTALSGVDPGTLTLAAEPGVPVLTGLRLGLGAVAKWTGYTRPAGVRLQGERRRRDAGSRALREALLGGELGPAEGAALLHATGVPMAPLVVVSSASDAARAAARVGYPVVVKGHGQGILHKHAAGLVITGVVDAAGARAAFEALSARLAELGAVRPSVCVQPQKQGLELFVGARNDPDFGPVTAVGTGGTEVESARSVAIHVGPVDRAAARRLLRESPAAPLLRGRSGAAGRSLAAAAAVVARLSSLAAALNDLVDTIEVNPLIVLSDEQGVAGVDLVVVRKSSTDKASRAAAGPRRSDADV